MSPMDSPASQSRSTAVLHLKDLVAGYVPGMPIVQGASLRVDAGEMVTIIGPNGAGKSTLMKAIAGLVHIESGQIDLRGQSLLGRASEQIMQAGVGFVPQNGNVFATLTIHENLRVGGYTLGAELAQRLEQAYALFPALAAKRGNKARTLSGGQRQMLAIARALMTQPNVLMLDEPSAGLAPMMVQEVFESLHRLSRQGVSVLMVEQNAKCALQHSDRAYILVEARNHLDGPARSLLGDPAVAAAFLGAGRKRVAA